MLSAKLFLVNIIDAIMSLYSIKFENIMSLYREVITEGAGTVGVVVSREQGAFGRVSAFYFVNSGTAVSGQDFSIGAAFGELVFEQNQDTAVINVNIIDDDIPEVDEEFCVLLSSPQSGATLGNITTS